MATTFRIDYTRLLDLWRSIEQAGGRDKYIQAQLKEKGFLIERKPTDNMSKAELERYKKTLKEEAAERRRLAREAWQAYKAAHLVHLGEALAVGLGGRGADAADDLRGDRGDARVDGAELTGGLGERQRAAGQQHLHDRRAVLVAADLRQQLEQAGRPSRCSPRSSRPTRSWPSSPPRASRSPVAARVSACC